MATPKKTTKKPAAKQPAKAPAKKAPAPKAAAKATKPEPQKLVAAAPMAAPCPCGPECPCGPDCDCGPDCNCQSGCACESTKGCCHTDPMFMGCHVAGLLTKRITWVSFFVALATVWATNFVTHVGLLMARYQETANLWLPENEMSFGLIWASEAITALAATLIFRLAYRGYGYVEGAKLGILAVLPMAGGASLMTLATQPIPADIAITWGIATLVQGALVGLALAGTSKCEWAHKGTCGGGCCGSNGGSCCNE